LIGLIRKFNNREAGHTAFFPADRKTEIIRSHGVEEIRLNDIYGIDSAPGELLHKYMVHLKTQQSYLSEYDVEGIVLIDELETHLHIELQKARDRVEEIEGRRL
jgi:hypothetical protein